MSDLDNEELKATREMKAINEIISPIKTTLLQQDDEYSNWWQCSNCKNDFYWGEYAKDIINSKIKYCMFCGAKIKDISFIEIEDDDE